MKIHLAWIRWTATAAVLAGVGVQPAAAQYAPYRPIQQQPATPGAQPTAQSTPRVAAQQPYWQPTARQTSAPAYQPAMPPYPQTSATYVPSVTPQQTPAYAPQQQYAPATAYAPSPSYAPSYAPTAVQGRSYPSYVARQPDAPATPPQPVVEEQMPAPVQERSMSSQPVEAANDPMPEGHVAPNGYAAGCNCNNGSYPAGGYYSGDQACGDGYDLSSYFDNPCHDSQWFGGVYWLFMERDDPSPEKLTVRVDHSAASDPYYPLAHTTVMSTTDTEYDFRSGVEVRLGSTFTFSDGCDTCDTGCYNGCNSCGSCSMPTVYAWEVAWWGLDDSPEDVTYEDQIFGDDVRIYGMKNFNGLLHDRDGAAGVYTGTNMNEYYGYELPIPDPGPGPYPDGYIAVMAQRVRTNFRAQNLELNIIRFPVCNIACGDCDSGCNSCDPCGCEQPCAPTSCFSMYGACGVRYFRADDDFMYATEFASWAGGAADQPGFDGWSYGDDNEIYYDVQVDNNLIGPQLGWTMNYCVGCKWNFFANSTFGVFNNHIEQVQRMWSGGGGSVYFAQNGEEYNVESDKDDISFLGELRLGGSYDITCNWRAVAAYRAVAVTGMANSTDQIPSDFTNYEYAQIIHSDNSLIVHGIQVGAECRY